MACRIRAPRKARPPMHRRRSRKVLGYGGRAGARSGSDVRPPSSKIHRLVFHRRKFIGKQVATVPSNFRSIVSAMLLKTPCHTLEAKDASDERLCIEPKTKKFCLPVGPELPSVSSSSDATNRRSAIASADHPRIDLSSLSSVLGRIASVRDDFR